jgi:hypothetical protein
MTLWVKDKHAVPTQRKTHGAITTLTHAHPKAQGVERDPWNHDKANSALGHAQGVESRIMGVDQCFLVYPTLLQRIKRFDNNPCWEKSGVRLRVHGRERTRSENRVQKVVPDLIIALKLILSFLHHGHPRLACKCYPRVKQQQSKAPPLPPGYKTKGASNRGQNNLFVWLIVA